MIIDQRLKMAVRALRVGLLTWGGLMLLGCVALLLDDTGLPRWVISTLEWASNIACFPGLLVSHLFASSADDPHWLFIAQAFVYLGTCVVAWSVLAWFALRVWDRRNGRRPMRAR